jgi:hypothetical protein
VTIDLSPAESLRIVAEKILPTMCRRCAPEAPTMRCAAREFFYQRGRDE